ncbi:inositol monophosphatase family protein [Methylobacterium gnaphalii]|uniref:3'(2'),5'-bisphosphate nucleotidase CysQ n=1 Tax=Methylobacterium gnaphalii TaxID=1010610 RepID=A0A512JGC3_9HYPH|nr:3'(2'),5'-bisphosphate nucleotidase CysQ [Methylobacterium gnaphalii]GEP08998.1 3'(2'),5'-bisphosphate nucleotidase CysQ [Methylobacterium gnaphalii]GJD67541.1 3'(2'),5'-bisphosphate nucleotidase CysQ [Methylobacterium gnaphalii]GLS51404.1 3'(2'),5'-bisphosphate nucleotidase CysQ [Methylobacterium gnaphalii]
MADTVLPAETRALAASLLPRVRETVREAAALAKPFFREGAQTRASVWSKAGGSPVTEADVAVDTFLKVRLSEIEPRAAWLSEETTDDPVRIDSEWVWIVDPIDGTRAFLSGHRDWSIAVALLAKGEPVIGIVYGPALGAFYEATAGGGASLNGSPIRASDATELNGIRITGPKPLQDRLVRGAMRLGNRPELTRIERIPSLALRVARIAEGVIDLGLISADSRDWDLAGADLILREAGGMVCDLNGEPARYNRPEPRHGELISAPLSLCEPALAALRAAG